MSTITPASCSNSSTAQPSLALCLAALLHDVGKPPTRIWDPAAGRARFNGHDKVGAEMAETIMRRLRYPNALIHDVMEMVSRHMQFMHVPGD